MKKCLIPLALAALILAFPVKCLAAPDCSAASCILMEPETGDVLFEKSADEPSRIASTTKIMTALVVLENCRLSERVMITEEAASVEGSSMYLAAGESLTVRELLYGLLLASGNDAAAAEGGAVGGLVLGGDVGAAAGEAKADLGYRDEGDAVVSPDGGTDNGVHIDELPDLLHGALHQFVQVVIHLICHLSVSRSAI